MTPTDAEQGPKIPHVGMALGLILGMAFGLVAAATDSAVLIAIAEGLRPLGTLFVRAIQMVVIPLVMAVVFVGVAGLGDLRKVGRLGGITLGFIWLTTLPAVLIGMGLMRFSLGFAPTVVPPQVDAAPAPEIPGLVDFLLRLVPSNPFEAASSGALLPLIIFTLLFAAAATTLPENQRTLLVGLAEAVTSALVRLVYWILLIGPIGVFGLMAPVAATAGWAMLGSLLVFILTVIAGLALLIGLIYVPLAWFVGGVGPGKLLAGSAGSLTVGFTTTSSVATLPVMLEEAVDLGVSERARNLVLPLAASLNRAGSGLFQGAAVVFLASLYNVTVPGGAWAGAVLATFFAASTVAPVPSASIMTLAPALDTVGAPLAGLGVLLGVDRIPDMFRSATNVLGHITSSIVVDGLTGGGEESDVAVRED